MRFVFLGLFLANFALSQKDIQLYFFDKQSKKAINDIILEIADKRYYSLSNKFSFDVHFRNQNIRISHIAYIDSSFTLDNSSSIYLTKRIFSSLEEISIKNLNYDSQISISGVYENNINLNQALSEHSSVQFSSYGQAGSLSEFKFRGLPALHSKIMIDGIPLNNFQNGSFNTVNTSLLGIDKIYVYGDGENILLPVDAIAAAVNLKPNDLLKNYVHINSSIGSYRRYKNQEELSYSIGKVAFYFGNVYRYSRNYYPYLRNYTDIGYRNEADYQNSEKQFRLDYYSERYELFYTWKFNQNDVGIPDGKIGETEEFRMGTSRQEDDFIFHLLKARFFLSPNFSLISKLSYQIQKLVYAKVGKYKNNMLYFNNQIEYAFSESLLLSTLISFQDGRLRSIASSKVFNMERDILSVSFKANYSFLKKFNAAVSIRKEFYTGTFKNIPAVTKFNLKYAAFAWLSFRGSINNHYRSPTFNELAFPNAGNPNLLPEFAYSRYFSTKVTSDNIVLQLNYFNKVIDNFISWEQMNGSLTALNIKSYQQEGIETSLQFKYKSFYLNAQYTYNHFVNDKEQQYYYVPLHRYRLSAGYRSKNSSIHLVYKWNDEFSIWGQRKAHPRENIIDVLIESKLPFLQFSSFSSHVYGNFYNILNIKSPAYIPYPKANFNYDIGIKLNYKLTQ